MFTLQFLMRLHFLKISMELYYQRVYILVSENVSYLQNSKLSSNSILLIYIF